MIEVESVISNDVLGIVRKVALLKDDMEFYYVNIYDYRNPLRTKVSPPILGVKEAVRQFNLCLENNVVLYS
jgi:hypothetical protein